jgi:hypothetical protein
MKEQLDLLRMSTSFFSEQSGGEMVCEADWKPWRGNKPMGVPIAV